jgi:hypothetical protein
MNEKQQLRESIDACRPGHTDWELPDLEVLREQLASERTSKELMRTLERSQQFDEDVRERLQEVEMPDGLVDRLLAGLDVTTPDSVCTVATAEQTYAARLFLNRRAAAAILTAAAALLLFVFLRPSSGPEVIYTAGELQASARDWLDVVSSEAWQAMSKEPPSEQRSHEHLARAPKGWQAVKLPGVGSATCYDLPESGPTPAYLFVMPAIRTMVAARRPPPIPSTTQEYCVGVWKQGAHVYVLVVTGAGARDYYERLTWCNPDLASLAR